MGFVVPNDIEEEVIIFVLNNAFTLRLFGNNATPTGDSVASDFTEISGGGYANKPIVYINWTIVKGNPTIATYSPIQEWTFTSPINAPGTIYGYYITRNSDGKLLLAERFAPAVVPFSPIAGSVTKVFPKFNTESLF